MNKSEMIKHQRALDYWKGKIGQLRSAINRAFVELYPGFFTAEYQVEMKDTSVHIHLTDPLKHKSLEHNLSPVEYKNMDEIHFKVLAEKLMLKFKEALR